MTLARKPNFLVVVFTRALREFIAAGAGAYGVPEGKIVTSHQFFNNILYQYGIRLDRLDDFAEQRRMLVENVSRVVYEKKVGEPV